LDGDRFCPSCGKPIAEDTELLTPGEHSEARLAAADAQLLADLVDATAGKYDVYGELGRGGMAVVYLAHDLALDRKVAIKVLLPALALTEGAADRFKNDALTAARLNHLHIIPIYTVRETARLVFFVMRFVEGKPLDELLIRYGGSLPVPLVRALIGQVGSALGHAHRHGVYHRDVKPSNILIDLEGSSLLTDFGIAKRIDVDGGTVTGATLGTPVYMSPEQCNAKPVTGRSDQYSLGVMAFEMLTGRVPFRADSAIEVMNMHCFEPLPPLRDLRPDCPDDIRTAVERMLEKDPERRFPTMDDAVGALGAVPLSHGDPIRVAFTDHVREASEELLARAQTPRSPFPATTSSVRSAAVRRPSGAPRGRTPAPISTPESSPTPIGRKRRRWPLILAAGVVVGGAGGWWWTSQRGATPTIVEEPPAPPPAIPTTGRFVASGLPLQGVVAIDGVRQDATEFELAPGRYEIGLTAPRYTSVVDTVDIVAGETIRMAYTGTPVRRTPASPRFVELRLRITPWARLTVDGVRYGERTQWRDSLPPGSHRLQLRREGFVPIDTIVRLRAGDPVREFGFDLARELARLRATIRPWASLSINGVDVGQKSRVDTMLVTGQYRLTFARDGYGTVDTLITLGPATDPLMIRMVEN
jgi:serine/threonine protein kinase